jgi:hypothetical protein
MTDHARRVANILAHYDAAPRKSRAAWLAWYTHERRTCRAIAREHGITVRQAAGIVACYSQNATWKANITMVRRFLADPANARGLSIAVGPARRILAGERPLDVLAADGTYYGERRFARDPFKLRSFYRNLAGDANALTIDRWAARAADGSAENPKDEREYEAFCAAYREAAKRRRVAPSAMQAIVWCQIRGTGE